MLVSLVSLHKTALVEEFIFTITLKAMKKLLIQFIFPNLTLLNAKLILVLLFIFTHHQKKVLLLLNFAAVLFA